MRNAVGSLNEKLIATEWFTQEVEITALVDAIIHTAHYQTSTE